MVKDLEGKRDLDEQEKRKTETETATKMKRHRVDDYIAIILGVGTVFVLWLLQWMGLY